MINTLKNVCRGVTADPMLREPLPYPENALSPYISSKTLSVHYGKHHRAYVERANYFVKGTGLEDLPLEEILRRSADHPKMRYLFNNAAQAWNHSFYWKGMKPRGGGKPGRELLDLIKSSFGSYEEFRLQFEVTAVSHFASGWIWLVKDKDRLKIFETHDADSPLAHDLRPLLTLDIWEHAYYLDYQNERTEYVKAYLDHLVNWAFAESQILKKGE